MPAYSSLSTRKLAMREWEFLHGGLLTHDQHSPPSVPAELLAAVAERQGFRTRDYALIWDDGKFDPSRVMLKFPIVTADGRQGIAQISHASLLQQDPWKYLGRIELAFKQLARRGRTR